MQTGNRWPFHLLWFFTTISLLLLWVLLLLLLLLLLLGCACSLLCWWWLHSCSEHLLLQLLDLHVRRLQRLLVS
jgi:hypothetical protein